MAQKPKTRKFKVIFRDLRCPKLPLESDVEAFNATEARGFVRWEACSKGIDISISNTVEVTDKECAA